MYNKLMKLSTEINNQDHRHTCMPSFYQIQTTEEIPAAEGCGETAWIFDGTIIRTTDEINNVLYDESNLSDVQIDKISDKEKEEKLLEYGWREINIDTQKIYQNAFFTEKACRNHIKQNHYHYSKPVDFLSYATRNSELEFVLEFLCGLTGGELHK